MLKTKQIFCYSTFNKNSTNGNKPSNDINKKGIRFDSLESGYEQIKYTYIGVAGVYKLTNKQDSGRFYIGSSVNLARRLGEYMNLINGIRAPQSNTEVEISKTSASNWSLEILYITSPQASLVYEQYALIKFKPTMNRYLSIVPRINPQWGGKLDEAISKIKEFLSLFEKDSFGYNRFNVFLKTFTIANGLKYTVEDTDSKNYSFLVFVYNKTFSHKDPIIYSSINNALKSLQISYGTLMECINNKYIYNNDLILSFEPLSLYNFGEYSNKPEGDNQLRKNIIVFNEYNEPVFEFKSGREMARYFKIDGKVARAAIAKGEFQNFSLITKAVSYRKEVFVFDSETLEFICKLDSITEAQKYAKLGFYTLKKLIDKKESYAGKIYSYNKQIKI